MLVTNLKMISEKKKRILFACMDWGLGHASRSVPLILQLKKEGHELVLASAGSAFSFLKSYFPDLTVIEKPAYNIRYSVRFPVSLMLLFQSRSFLKTIRKEHHWLNQLLTKEQFDEIYSDNCYGLYNQKIRSTIITHQLMVKCPKGLGFLERPLHKKILSYTNKFDACLIPDYEGEANLSGDLSHKYELPANATFIGPLSRFEKRKDEFYEKQYEFCAILSGPEPLRTELENQCIDLFKKTGKKCVIIRGLPGANHELHIDGIEVYNHLNDDEFRQIVVQSDKIICRSGYSTIMDLHALNKRAIYIPTPGQTEQEYLAKHNSR